MATIHKVKIGQKLYNCKRYRNSAGQSVQGTDELFVTDVNIEEEYIVVIGNGRTRKLRNCAIKQLRVNPPNSKKKI